MSCFRIPISVGNGIEQSAAQFWWGSSSDQPKKLHWKSWSKLATAKEEGGLGFRNFQDFNLALLAKQLWRLITKPNLLMCKVMKAKYFPRGGLLHAQATGQSSWVWKSWISAKPLLLDGVRYQIGDGKSARIWDSPWLSSTPNFRPETKRPDHCHLHWVSELICPTSHSWNTALIQSLFSPKDSAAILQTPISQLGIHDKLVWQYSPHGNFTVTSAYRRASQLRHPSSAPESSHHREFERAMWKRLWSMKVPGKIKHFMWRAYHRILPTNDRLLQKGLEIDPICRGCGESSEFLEHIFFSCRKAQIIWKLSPVLWESLPTLPFDFQGWWRRVCSLGRQPHHQDRIELTACLLWNIWKMRNQWSFSSLHIPEPEVVSRSLSDWQDFQAAQRHPAPHPPLPVPRHNPCPHQHLRSTFLVGYHCLDTSSNTQRRPLKTATGILVHNQQGTLQLAKVLIGSESKETFRLALEAVRSAQLLAYQSGWKKVVIRNDVQEIIGMLHSKKGYPCELSMIAEDIILLSNLFDDCRFFYVPRQENKICRKLVCKGLDLPISETWDTHLPAWLLQ